ncbi:sulfatase-like hydrolase/transferase [Streptomyces sp. 184]|uniref:sulfatase-like hydrolase/transferase n=1 Tax=Streptomyces sp. 184 TaxID=1827526 RepID=UPI0038916C16
MSSRRHFLTGSAALGLAVLPPGTARAAGRSPAAAGGGRRPNVVVILADDLGFGGIGAYGQRLVSTPRLDRLAAEGLRFTQAYSAAAVCAPSRCAALTGLHAGHGRVRENPFGGPQGSLTEDDTTFAEVLRARGYRTACIGKWGFGPEEADQPSHPQARGFTDFYGYITHGHAHQYYPQYLWHNGAKERIPENADGARGAFVIDLLQGRAVSFLDAHAGGPFLLMLNPNVPHAPSDIPDLGEYADRPWSDADKGHAAQITRLDSLVGAVVDALRRLDVHRDTLLLFSSDNGPHEEGGVDPDLFDENGPLRGYKRNLYEGGVRVPLIAWRPGTVRPGVSDRPTPLTDLLPTLAEVAGAPAPRDIDGLSAGSLLTARPAAGPGHRHLYWYRNDPGATKRANAVDGGRILRLAESVRRRDWKAVRFAPGRDRDVPDAEWEVELYDLAADPGETRDVAAAHPGVVAELTGLLRSSWADRYDRERFGTRIEAPELAYPGEPFTVTATLANGSDRVWTDARIRLDVPAGWRLRPAAPARTALLRPGAVLRTVVEVVPARGDTAAGARLLRAEGTARYDRGTLRYPASRAVAVPPPAPRRDSFLSDLQWVSARNGWGPVELDRSNGRQPAGDGTPISFGGVTYAKGLGVHAHSEIVYHLGAAATRLTAVVGIDDFSAAQSANGATVAQVWGDGRRLYDSGTLTAATGPREVDVDVTGVRLLRLVVQDANGSTSYDHTSWAAAHVRV